MIILGEMLVILRSQLILKGVVSDVDIVLHLIVLTSSFHLVAVNVLSLLLYRAASQVIVVGEIVDRLQAA